MTIALPDQLAERARQVAIDRGVSLDELVRQALEVRLDVLDDPLFTTYAVYEGPAPSDLSERHDDYLYPEKE